MTCYDRPTVSFKLRSWAGRKLLRGYVEMLEADLAEQALDASRLATELDETYAAFDAALSTDVTIEIEEWLNGEAAP